MNEESPAIPTEAIISKEKPTIPKEPKKELSKTQQIKNLIESKLDSGYQLNDKNTRIELCKIILDELKLSKGWTKDINKAIKEISIDKKLQISDLGFKNDKVGDMTVSVIKNEPTLPEPIKSNVPHGALPKDTHTKYTTGALPKQTGEQQTETRTEQSEEPERYMSESAQKKLISSALTKVIFPIYTAMGIVELDESEIKEESTIPKGKKVKAEFEELASDIDEYLTENNIQLPAFLNHIAIMISIFVVLVLPVIKFKFFTTKTEAKPEYDSSADKLEVKT